MNKDYNSIEVNKEVFTLDDAKDAAKQICENQVEDFYALKDENWYKHLLNAITFGSDRKKKVIRDIRSLSKLQTIFLRVYSENYKEQDAQLNEIIENIAKTNESIGKIYRKYVVGIDVQSDFSILDDLEKEILLLFLGEYKSLCDNDESFQKFRIGVRNSLKTNEPSGEFEPSMLGQINTTKKVNIFYRLIVEMCAIDECLDDFSVPDNIRNAIDYLHISTKEKEKIEKDTKKELEIYGRDGLVTKYDSSEDDFWDDDIEIMDEDELNEEFKTITIDKELKIAKGESVEYKNKEIIVHDTVICEGKLIFDNCTLKYNDSALSAEILIKKSGQLSICGCTFICLSHKEDYFFKCEGNVDIKESKFYDCSYLFKASKDFFVDKCEINNCAVGLFGLYAYQKVKIKICNSRIIQGDLKEFYKDNIKSLRNEAMILERTFGAYDSVRQFNNNLVIEKTEFADLYEKEGGFKYIDSEEMSLTQSTFWHTSGIIKAPSIEECYFKGCKNPILSGIAHPIKIENCIFDECEDVISASDNSNISYCQFVSCKNKLIDCFEASDGGVIVDSCIFKNVQNDFEENDSDLESAYRTSALIFRRSKRIASNENRVVDCNFDGVNMKKAFLIASGGYERPFEDATVSVYRCTFSHCISQRKSKKLIKEYFSYYGLFNRKKHVHATRISDCKGLEKINLEGFVADDLIIDYTSTYGRKIGADLTQ